MDSSIKTKKSYFKHRTLITKFERCKSNRYYLYMYLCRICVLVTKSLNDRLDNSYDQPVTMLERETNLDRETHIILYPSVFFPMNEEYSE